MTTRILLAVDGRAASDTAARWAAERARRSGSALHIVSVATDDGPLAEIARQAVDQARHVVGAMEPQVAATTEVVRANVFDGILLAAEDADLLVVGSEGASSRMAALPGRLPTRLSGRVECDLAVIPAGWDWGARGGVVVAGWDEDRIGDDAIDVAALEAEAIGASVRIVHVGRHAWVSPYETGAAEFAEYLERAEEAAVLQAAEQARRRHPGLTFTAETHRGSIVHGLLAHRGDVDLVVVGSHRRTAVGEALFGSTGDALIRASESTPILIARTSERLVAQD